MGYGLLEPLRSRGRSFSRELYDYLPDVVRTRRVVLAAGPPGVAALPVYMADSAAISHRRHGSRGRSKAGVGDRDSPLRLGPADRVNTRGSGLHVADSYVALYIRQHRDESGHKKTDRSQT